jgi:L-threonylcarbamoyladenylate synthase
MLKYYKYMTRTIMLTDSKLTQAIMGGAVAVIPTDTVYGIVCSAANPAAVTKLYALKHREHKPGTIIAASVDQLVELGLKQRYMTPVVQYWPGAVSVVIPSHELEYLHQGVGSLAVRIPSDTGLQTLLKQTGPLLTSSANLPGQAVANTVEEAQAYFGDAVEYYVDGGDLTSRQPSTIVRVVDDALEVLRAGAVTIQE